jgi:hypothetical protein
MFCENGHYICDQCHSKEAIEIIERMCEFSDSKDPFKLANKMMKHPSFKMYGPEHHALVPAVILTVLKNNNVTKINGKMITLFDIKDSIKRGSAIPGGWCGFYGACGAGIGSGIVISILTGDTPSSSVERTLANRMTSITISKITDNLQHCCKRSVRISICETLHFIEQELDISLSYNLESCDFSQFNDRCEGVNCPFF